MKRRSFLASTMIGRIVSVLLSAAAIALCAWVLFVSGPRQAAEAKACEERGGVPVKVVPSNGEVRCVAPTAP